MLTIHTRNADGTYGPSSKNTYYQPKADHGVHSRKPKKTKWKILESQELSVFEIAESPVTPKVELFCKENNCYFSIIDNGNFILGTTQERVAKFPKPENDTDPWHGYPVKCVDVQNIPSDDLLDIMVAQKNIDATTRRRIERKKI